MRENIRKYKKMIRKIQKNKINKKDIGIQMDTSLYFI